MSPQLQASELPGFLKLHKISGHEAMLNVFITGEKIVATHTHTHIYIHTYIYIYIYKRGVLISSWRDHEGNKLQRQTPGFIQDIPHKAQ